MDSISDLRDRLNTDDHRLWLLIGLCVAVVLTLEVVEEAVEGVWPHQRRMSGMDIGQQRAHQIWALVALLVMPAAILATMNVGMMVWKDTPTTDGIRTGAALLGIGWIAFLLANIDRLRLRSLVSRAGPVLPVTLAIILVIAIALLLTAFLDVRPDMQTIRDAIPGLNSSD